MDPSAQLAHFDALPEESKDKRRAARVSKSRLAVILLLLGVGTSMYGYNMSRELARSSSGHSQGLTQQNAPYLGIYDIVNR
mmetsp:Transcript_2650/g.4437  ORF Transcript_2650/g.4437 Transcript_2650/m.4437 type:complete len:81 (-) Transcript_2650:1675-1917(-)